MIEKTWFDYLTAFGAAITPVVVIIYGTIDWRLRRKAERRLELEDNLREDRITIYNTILEPFVILLMTDAAWQNDEKHRSLDKKAVAYGKFLSLEYRKFAFKLALLGADNVVIAYNDLMQYVYSLTNESNTNEKKPEDMMGFLGAFLLEIRRNLGNETTKLDKWGMMEWLITDARSIREKHTTTTSV